MNQKIDRPILITGATGYIGSQLATAFVKKQWPVHVIKRETSTLAMLDPVIEAVTIHTHDGSSEKMMEIMGSVKPVLVIHLAAYWIAEHKLQDIEPLVRSDILFPTQLVEAMVKNDVHYLINTGTAWQHYNSTDYNPVCLYAAMKQAFESILKYYVELNNLQVLTLKLFDTYGPNDNRKKFFTLFENSTREKTPIAMSPGDQLLDLVYIDDVVEAYTVAAERLLLGKVTRHESYGISSGTRHRLRDIAELYAGITGKQLNIHWGGRAYRAREVMVPWDGGSKLPGWSPRISLEEGIRRLVGK